MSIPPAAAAAATTPGIAGLHDDEVLAQLRSGANEPALRATFGDAEYVELRRLALAVAARRTRGGPRVLILPGIMGSRIGTPGRLRDDILWLDPIEIMAGKLVELALPQGRRLKPVGVMLFGYLKLKLTLRLAGFDAGFHAYDWRLGLDHLGQELAARIDRERSRNVRLVAHSMGGLVARAALNCKGSERIEQLIQLGTPNYGSFAPVQALRATYPTVRKIAALDRRHSAEELAEKVFRTFPGLYQMLPSPERHTAINFFTPGAWPRDVLAPDGKMLAEARRVQAALAAADERCCLIVGTNQETVTAARRTRDSFEYSLTLEGDGTVPRALAEWPKARTWYVEETHGGLTNNAVVGATVIDLLKTGDTQRLPAVLSRKRRVVTGRVRDATLRQRVTGKVSWTDLSLEARRKLLEPVIAAEFHGEAGPGVTTRSAPPASRLIDSRQRRRSLEIRLAHGSITEVQSEAIVLGVFRGVEPGGAAAAIDARLQGAVKEFTLRRMFSGNRGEVFVLPSGRSRLGADLVLLAGLGDFDRFDAAAQQFVAENVVRTFVRTHIDEFASVLLGGGSGVSIEVAVANQIGGYLKALKESDTERRLRRITLVEYDRAKYAAIRQALIDLSATPLFDDIEVSLDEVELPVVTVAQAATPAARGAEQRFAYLIVSQDSANGRELALRASVLTSGAKAAVLTGTKTVPRRQLQEHLERIAHSDFTLRRLSGYGEVLGAMLLHRDVLTALETVKAHHLVVVHDSAAAAYPWETLCVNGRFPAAAAGLSRRYAAENLSVARWREVRRQDAVLDVLLVVDPTADLPAAAAEGERLNALLGKDKSIRMVELRGTEATRGRLLDEFRSGRYDVLHYAGHAFFDPQQPGRSGIVCADNKVLSGADLANVTELPALAFFNACEAGRIRSGARFSERASARLQRNVSLAEAFLRGGVANYVGTYWPVGDIEAGKFAATFYRALVRGRSVGMALNAGRAAVRRLGSVDWADYLHYGNFDFRIKQLL